MFQSNHASLPALGFTLIEILIAIAISMVVLGIAIAGYLQFEKVQRVQQATRDIQQLYAETQRKAQVRDQTGCQPTIGSSKFGEVDKYTVKYVPMTKEVWQVTDCADPISDKTVKTPISSSVSVDAVELSFAPLTSQVNLVTPSSSCPNFDNCQIVISEDSISYSFTITAGGQIGSVKKQ